jgi:hypothetical protein
VKKKHWGGNSIHPRGLTRENLCWAKTAQKASWLESQLTQRKNPKIPAQKPSRRVLFDGHDGLYELFTARDL